MTIDLLPGRGLRLPAPLPEVPFGLDRAEVLRLFAPHADALPGGVRDTFVCGPIWSLHFTLPGLGVTLCAAGPARDGSGWAGEPEDAFQTAYVSRNPHDDRPPCPVGLYGVDVFGWPAHEVVEALRAGGLALPDPSGGSVRHGVLDLYREGPAPRPPAPGRKPRREPPFAFGTVALSAVDRTVPDTR
ncbi:hypothetical protein [Kitasatospora sp. NPDC101183]|uniref:hypothetical protein n=1 Tax=Kitasatospora sp. NPDC101183 TaxID=3364100 RepID=UPI0038097A3B